LSLDPSHQKGAEIDLLSKDNQHTLERFILQGRTLVQEILPKLRQLLIEPEREDLLLSAIGRGYELFLVIRQNASKLHLAHLLAPSEAMATMLERARLNQLQLTSLHISLFIEVCSFVDQGLELISKEHTDQRLAAPATALQAAVEEVLYASQTVNATPLPFVGVALEIRDTFMQESEQLLTTAEQEFVLWDFIAIDHERVSQLCRILHRLKQNFSIYDCQDFERLSMALESALNRYLQGEFFHTEYPERVFLRCIDAMRESLTRFSLSEILTIDNLEEHLVAVQGLIRQPLGELLIEAGLVDPRTVDDALALQKTSPGDHPRRIGEVLVGMGEVTREQVEEVLQRQEVQRKQVEHAETHLETRGRMHNELRSMVPFFPQEVAVDGQKLARIVSIIKQLAALQLPMELEPFVQELDQLSRSLTLQSTSGFSQHLQRIVHDFAIYYNKRVHFHLEGATVMEEEFDRGKLTDLLIPLLRNSVQHGVEPVKERQETEKKKNGRVALSALQQGGEIWISVEDDGVGFDLKKIARECFDHGLVNRNELGNMTGAELLQIFLNNQNCAPLPVAEEARQCTGLAVVKKMLQDFNGKMDIWSRPEKGARVTLRIPQAS